MSINLNDSTAAEWETGDARDLYRAILGRPMSVLQFALSRARAIGGVPVKNLLTRAAIGMLLAGGAVAGCSSDDGPRYVERVPVAAPDSPASRVEYERPRPMPEPAAPAPALR